MALRSPRPRVLSRELEIVSLTVYRGHRQHSIFQGASLGLRQDATMGPFVSSAILSLPLMSER
jgi:hypothetical protein